MGAKRGSFARRDARVEEDGGVEVHPLWREPLAAMTPATGRLRLGQHHGSLGGTAVRQPGQHAVGGVNAVEDVHVMTHDLSSQMAPQRLQTQASTSAFHRHNRILGVANSVIVHGFNPPSS